VVQRELFPDGSETVTKTVTVTDTVKRTTYPQDWPAYNDAQAHEKDRFQMRLNDLCSGIVEPDRVSVRGRKTGRLRSDDQKLMPTGRPKNGRLPQGLAQVPRNIRVSWLMILATCSRCKVGRMPINSTLLVGLGSKAAGRSSHGIQEVVDSIPISSTGKPLRDQRLASFSGRMAGPRRRG
jgi:hypothetical protein